MTQKKTILISDNAPESPETSGPILLQDSEHGYSILSDTHLRLAMEAANIGAWEWHITREQFAWSFNFASLLGLKSEAFSGTFEAWLACMHPDDREYAKQIFVQALEYRRDVSNEFRIITPTGATRWLHCKGRMECDALGNPIRMLGIAQDITERRQTEEWLRQFAKERSRQLQQEQAAREQAESASHTKDEFLAMVTHELRTPLNAILGWAKLLRSRDMDSDTVDRALETIERNARSQSTMIEDLLDISRIIRGKLRLTRVPVNLRSVIQAAIEVVKLSAEDKQIALEVQYCEDQRLNVTGDPSRLQQIILNLLTNAIKFTPNGGQVTITAGWIDTQAEITVTDTGIGIEAEFLPLVFDRFRQAEMTEEGLGLGLAIVHQLVELHHGSVGVASEGINRGTTFTVRFPVCG